MPRIKYLNRIVLLVVCLVSFSAFAGDGRDYSRMSKRRLIRISERRAVKAQFERAWAPARAAVLKDSTFYKANYNAGMLLAYDLYRKDTALVLLERAARLTPKNDTAADLLLALAETYQYMERYSEAIRMYRSLQGRADASKEGDKFRSRMQQYITQCEYGKLYRRPVADLRISNLGPAVNTNDPEYVPVINASDSLLFFTSRRKGKKNRIDFNDNKYYEDMFIAVKKNGAFAPATPFEVNNAMVAAVGNTKTHEAVVSVTADNQRLYTCRDKKLYVSQWKNGAWQEPVLLPETINRSDYQNHACESPDGTMLVFSSNAAGGQGGLDLYAATKQTDGTWGNVQHLGNAINTAADEESPFMGADGKTLYFASKGLKGYGGYDLFRVSYTNGTWGTPENMGRPFNESGDDIYITMSADGKQGYLASDRRRGKGDMDIYSFRYYERPYFDDCVPATDPSVVVRFSAPDTAFVNTAVVFDASATDFPVAEPAHFFWNVADSTLKNDSQRLTRTFAKTGTYNVRLQVVANNCDSCGMALVHCFEKKIVVVSKRDSTEPQIVVSRRDSTQRRLEPVYFDFDKSTLRPDAIAALDKNIEALKANPGMRIRLTGHADARGTTQYNEHKIAQKRIDAVKAYLLKNGIKPERIVSAEAKGETEPAVNCVEKDCSDAEHQLNRRVEFKLVR